MNFTKLLYLTGLILITSGSIRAQNWNTIIVSDTNYFAVQATGMDSMWQGYLRCIYDDSVFFSGGITTNQFYASIRYDAAGNIDTASGDTWLGRRNLVLTNGDEYYFNRRGDSILLKPQANIGDSWIMNTDSLGRQFIATVSASNTKMIDGVLDSIKTIQLQAYLGSSLVSSVYNSLPLVLSKSHGFYSLFEFYCFPYIDTVASLNSIITYRMPFYELPLPHIRVEKSITHINYKQIDLASKYTIGNFWQISTGGLGDYSYWQDSVLGNNIIAPDSITALVYTDLFRIENIPMTTFDTMFHVYSTINSSYKDSQIAFISTITPEHKKYFSNYPIHPDLFSHGFYWYFVDSICGNVRLRDSFHIQTWVSGSFSKAHDYLTGFGLLSMDDYGSQVIGSGTSYKVKYFKIGSCVYGTYVSVSVLETSNLLTNSDFLIYPNPTKDNISIQSNLNEKVNLSLFDMSGQILVERKINSTPETIDISRLTPGLYILKLSSNTNSIYKKIVKE